MSETQPSPPPKPEELTPEELARSSGESQSTQPKQVNAEHLHELAGEGEGIRSNSPDQMSVFDSTGRESVVVVGTDESGRRKQGTGGSAAEAGQDAGSSKEPIGEGFYPPPE
ncbi:MAG: hypothetical protein M3314_16095 [Actinomycetota bacterium]|nr:hypothetical protein [Actinomycetota bacterium]